MAKEDPVELLEQDKEEGRVFAIKLTSNRAPGHHHIHKYERETRGFV